MSATATGAVLSSAVPAAPVDEEAAHRFYLATLMFHRARQLKSGARPRVDSSGHALVRVAVLEVMAGLVVSEATA